MFEFSSAERAKPHDRQQSRFGRAPIQVRCSAYDQLHTTIATVGNRLHAHLPVDQIQQAPIAADAEYALGAHDVGVGRPSREQVLESPGIEHTLCWKLPAARDEGGDITTGVQKNVYNQVAAAMQKFAAEVKEGKLNIIDLSGETDAAKLAKHPLLVVK